MKQHLLVTAALVLAACSSSSGSRPGSGEPPPDGAVQDPDAKPMDPPIDLLDAFSAATKAHYHLIASGEVVGGRKRVYYAPKTMWPAAFGTGLQVTGTVLVDGYLLGGTFAFQATGDVESRKQLVTEASVANLVLVVAPLGVPHVICAPSSAFSSVTLGGACDAAPSTTQFDSVSFTASANNLVFQGVVDKVALHAADGGAWDDVLVGDIAWHAPDGQVLHTKLEISCAGDPSNTLFDSPACRARYGR